MWTAENKTKQKCQCGRKCFASLLVETRTDTFKNALQRPICSIEHSGSISTPSSVGWDVVHCCITLQHEIQQFLFPAHSEERGTVRVLTCLTQEHCPVTPAMAQNQSASNTQFDAPTMMLLSVPPISPNTIRVKKKHTVSFLLFLSHLNDLF